MILQMTYTKLSTSRSRGVGRLLGSLVNLAIQSDTVRLPISRDNNTAACVRRAMGALQTDVLGLEVTVVIGSGESGSQRDRLPCLTSEASKDFWFSR